MLTISKRLLITTLFLYDFYFPFLRWMTNVLPDIHRALDRWKIIRISFIYESHQTHKCLVMEVYSFNGVLASRKFIYRLLEYHLIGFSIIDASIIEITRGELNHGGSGCAIFIRFEHVLGISFIRAIYRKWKYTCFVHEKNVSSCNAHDSWTHTNFHTNCFSFVVEVQHCTKVLVYLTNYLWTKISFKCVNVTGEMHDKYIPRLNWHA